VLFREEEETWFHLFLGGRFRLFSKHVSVVVDNGSLKKSRLFYSSEQYVVFRDGSDILFTDWRTVLFDAIGRDVLNVVEAVFSTVHHFDDNTHGLSLPFVSDSGILHLFRKNRNKALRHLVEVINRDVVSLAEFAADFSFAEAEPAGDDLTFHPLVFLNEGLCS